MTTTTRHRAISDEFLDQAELEFDRGDFLQASEKAWGAVSHYIKAVAKENDWPHRSTKNSEDNSVIITSLTDDPQLNDVRFAAVQALHHNFYNEDLPESRVRAGLRAARELIAEMEKVESRVPSGVTARRRARREIRANATRPIRTPNT